MNGSPVVAPLTCPSGRRGPQGGRDPRRGPRLHPQRRRQLLPGASRAASTPRCTPTRRAAPGLDATRVPGGRACPRSARWAARPPSWRRSPGVIRALDLAVNEYQGGADGVAAWNPATRPVPARLARAGERPPVPHRPGGRRRRRAAGGGGRGRHRQHGPAGLQRRRARPPSTEWPRLTGDWMVATPLVGLLRAARDRPAPPSRSWSRSRGGARCSPTRRGAGACAPGLLAPLPPRQRQLRRLRARRRGPGQARAPGGGARQARLRRAGRRPPLRHRRQVRDRAVRLADRRRELRRRGRRGGCAGAGRGGRPPPGHAARRPPSATSRSGPWTSRATWAAPPPSTPARPGTAGGGPSGARRHAPAGRPGATAPARRCLPRRSACDRVGGSAPCACGARVPRPEAPLPGDTTRRRHHRLLRARRRPRRRCSPPARADRPDRDHGQAPPHAPDRAGPRLPRRGIRGARRRQRGLLVGTLRPAAGSSTA